MLRVILIAVIIYIVYLLLRYSLHFVSRKDNLHGQTGKTKSKGNLIDKSKVEDAEFEEIK